MSDASSVEFLGACSACLSVYTVTMSDFFKVVYINVGEEGKCQVHMPRAETEPGMKKCGLTD